MLQTISMWQSQNACWKSLLTHILTSRHFDFESLFSYLFRVPCFFFFFCSDVLRVACCRKLPPPLPSQWPSAFSSSLFVFFMDCFGYCNDRLALMCVACLHFFFFFWLSHCFFFFLNYSATLSVAFFFFLDSRCTETLITLSGVSSFFFSICFHTLRVHPINEKLSLLLFY